MLNTTQYSGDDLFFAQYNTSDTFPKQRLLAEMVEFLDTFLNEYFYAKSKYDLQGKK